MKVSTGASHLHAKHLRRGSAGLSRLATPQRNLCPRGQWSSPRRDADACAACGEAEVATWPRVRQLGSVLLWMEEIHFAPLGHHGKPLFVGIYKGISIPGFLRLCRSSSIHTTTCFLLGRLGCFGTGFSCFESLPAFTSSIYLRAAALCRRRRRPHSEHVFDSITTTCILTYLHTMHNAYMGTCIHCMHTRIPAFIHASMHPLQV